MEIQFHGSVGAWAVDNTDCSEPLVTKQVVGPALTLAGYPPFQVRFRPVASRARCCAVGTSVDLHQVSGLGP